MALSQILTHECFIKLIIRFLIPTSSTAIPPVIPSSSVQSPALNLGVLSFLISLFLLPSLSTLHPKKTFAHIAPWPPPSYIFRTIMLLSQLPVKVFC